MRKFQVGDLVRYNLRARVAAPLGTYEVVACLPREDHAPEYLYRIKSAAEQTARVVSENELTGLS